jgi:hypothetical protein
MKVIVSHDNEGHVVSIGVPMRTSLGVKPRPGLHVVTLDIEPPLHRYVTGHRVDVSAKPPRLVRVTR